MKFSITLRFVSTRSRRVGMENRDSERSEKRCKSCCCCCCRRIVVHLWLRSFLHSERYPPVLISERGAARKGSGKKYHINCIVLTTTGDLLSARTTRAMFRRNLYCSVIISVFVSLAAVTKKKRRKSAKCVYTRAVQHVNFYVYNTRRK